MNLRWLSIPILALSLAGAGCDDAPGRPKDEAMRPQQVLDFPTLYAQNCAACHGEQGKNGAAISLANPVYLATAGAANLQRVTASGVNGTMMPGFGSSAGGMLTDQQIGVLAQGMIDAWGKPAAPSALTPPSYASSLSGDSARGEKAFVVFCARCHGADGTGASSGKKHTGSLVDPAYLSMISDQGLRSLIVAGQPEQGMPDWRSDMSGSEPSAATGQGINDKEITDIIAWLAAHRIATPGQPYPIHP